jgi:hypothetical protein
MPTRSSDRMDVVAPDAVAMDERALTRALHEVFDGGDRDDWIDAHNRSAPNALVGSADALRWKGTARHPAWTPTRGQTCRFSGFQASRKRVDAARVERLPPGGPVEASRITTDRGLPSSPLPFSHVAKRLNRRSAPRPLTGRSARPEEREDLDDGIDPDRGVVGRRAEPGLVEPQSGGGPPRSAFEQQRVSGPSVDKRCTARRRPARRPVPLCRYPPACPIVVPPVCFSVVRIRADSGRRGGLLPGSALQTRCGLNGERPRRRRTLVVRAGEQAAPAVRARRQRQQPHVDGELRPAASGARPPTSPAAAETRPASPELSRPGTSSSLPVQSLPTGSRR